jgi:hypothetical protein
MNIDLNLHNYTNQDIERLFGLSSSYTSSELHQKENDLALKFKNHAPALKDDILSFLKKAKNRLLEPSPSIPPSSEIKRLICIDSLFRPHYEGTSPSDFIFFMPEYKKVTSITIVSVELPSSWYLFSEAAMNSTFYITVNNKTHTFTIPDGNYTSEEIYSLLNLLLDDFNEQHHTDLHAVLQPSKKLIFTSNTAFSISFVSESAYRNTCGMNLGFIKNEYKSTTAPYAIHAESIYGMNADKYVYIEINDFQKNFEPTIMSVTTNSLGVNSYIGNNFMAKVPFHGEPLFKTRTYSEPVALDKLQLRLLNRYGNEFNLNHSNYSLTIEMTELY